jgi:hypothetical protein
MKKLKLAVKRSMLAGHRLMSRAGIHVLRRHYYSCVPDGRELAESKTVWAKASQLPGIDAPLDRQAQALKEICLPYQAEYEGNRVYAEAVRLNSGPGFGYIEAQALHGVVRHLKPSRIVEVGSGVSTRCALAALELNARDGGPGKLTCIEPFPFSWLKDADVDLLEKKVQETDLSLFESLEDGDLLFIDSSHTVKAGSDVNFEILEVLPRLKKGVWVHFHDIYLPYDYQRDLMQTLNFWSETSLLRAYLTDNPRAKIVFALSMLHYGRQDALKEVFPEYVPQKDVNGLDPPGTPAFESPPGHFPSSLYFRMVS